MKLVFKIITLLFFLGEMVSAQSLFERYNEGSIFPNEIIAEVGPINITAEEFFYSYEFGPAFPKRENNSKEVHLKYMINEKLLALAGLEKKLLEKEEIYFMFEDIAADLATEELFKEKILSSIDYTQKEVEDLVAQKNIELDLSWLVTKETEVLEKYLKV